MGPPALDARSNTSYGNTNGMFMTNKMSQAEYPYQNPADEGDDIDMDIDGLDTKVIGTRIRASSPHDSIADPSSFVDGSTRMHEDAPYTGGSSTRIFTTGPGRHIGSMKGWSSSPDPLPGDDDPEYYLKDIFDDEERYMKRINRDVRIIEALDPKKSLVKSKRHGK